MNNTSITNYAPETGLSIFDKGHFENLCNISAHLGRSPLIPATLKGKTDEETAANCLLVVEQSQRWGLSPFAVMQCASVVHGRLMWEGKLVAGVIEAKLGIRLSYTYEGSGLKKGVVVSGQFADEKEPRTITGTVEQWKTTGNGSPWEKESAHERMLAYRGAREWARRHCPSLMLGIVTDDEELPQREMRDVSPKAVTTEFSAALPAIEAAPLPPDPPPQTEQPKQETPPQNKTIATVMSVTDAGEETIIVLRGKSGDVVATALNDKIADKAAGLIDLPCEVRVKKSTHGAGYVLHHIEIYDEQEGGSLV